MFLFSVSGVLASPTNLIINDLEAINFDGLTVQDYIGNDIQDSACLNGIMILFEVNSYTSIYPDFPFRGGYGDSAQGRLELGLGIFKSDGEENYYGDKGTDIDNNPIAIRITTDCIADIREGDYITLTYDGGQTLDVYLPETKDRMYKDYFVSTDGLLYNEGSLTTLLSSSEAVTLINVYRFDDNVCSLVSIDEDTQTNLEFLTLNECEENILPQLCEESSIKQYSCVDGVTNVDWCVCTNVDWVCSDNPETQCPEIPKGNSGMIIIGLIVTLLVIFTIAFYVKKRK